MQEASNGTLISIGEDAFCETGIATISFPSSLNVLEEGCFAASTKLTSLIIPDSVTYVGANVFGQCTSLKSVVLMNCATWVSPTAFYAVPNLLAEPTCVATVKFTTNVHAERQRILVGVWSLMTYVV